MHVERRLTHFETAFWLRLALGPEFGNISAALNDQRLGKPTPHFPFLKYHRQGHGSGSPYYLARDIYEFIEEIRLNPQTREKAKAGVKPVFREVDLVAEMMLT